MATGAPHLLVGRSTELADLDRFLTQSRASGGALLLVGEPGVGKTSLLAAGVRTAEAAGTRVVRVSGTQYEVATPFAGLTDVLTPLLPTFVSDSASQRDAVEVALGLRDGAPPSRLVLSTAATTIVRQAARAGALLVVVDDVHWLDQGSADVLAFVARRLFGTRTGLLMASRPTGVLSQSRSGLPTRQIVPLDPEDSDVLLATRFPNLAVEVRRRLVEEAEGNPLALAELPASLTGAQRRADEALPRVLPMTDRLLSLFSERLVSLPTDTQRLLLLMALESSGDIRLLQAALGRPILEHLAPAEAARVTLVDSASGRIVFAHPLIRSAVVSVSTEQQRRDAHRSLADVLDAEPERHAWHVAEAVPDLDDQAASALEQAAVRAVRRGDPTAAVTALLRAAALSTQGPDRARRLAGAAGIEADVTGDLGAVSRLLDDALNADPASATSLEAVTARASVLLNEKGDPQTAHDQLATALHEHGATSRPRAITEALWALELSCTLAYESRRWRTFERLVEEHAAVLPTYLTLAAAFSRDRVRPSAATLSLLDEQARRLTGEPDSTTIVRLAWVACDNERTAGLIAPLRRVRETGMASGALTSVLAASWALCYIQYTVGDWDEVERIAEETLVLCETSGYRVYGWAVLWIRSLVAAARGRRDLVEADSRATIDWAGPRGATAVQMSANSVFALDALARADFDAAYHYQTALAPADFAPEDIDYTLRVAMDLAEAASGSGRQSDADAYGAILRGYDLDLLAPRVALVVAGAIAMTSATGSAVAAFERALALPGTGRWPFDLARIRLAYGDLLRRTGAAEAARTHLGLALQTFTQLRAEPWAQRAATGLRATGHGVSGLVGVEDLTSQEHRIASLAASGLTNRQIGEQLFLSPRTVAHHLLRAFPKLGVTSRAALRDALVATERRS